MAKKKIRENKNATTIEILRKKCDLSKIYSDKMVCAVAQKMGVDVPKELRQCG